MTYKLYYNKGRHRTQNKPFTPKGYLFGEWGTEMNYGWQFFYGFCFSLDLGSWVLKISKTGHTIYSSYKAGFKLIKPSQIVHPEVRNVIENNNWLLYINQTDEQIIL